MEKAEGSAHNPNIEQKKEGVKKEQEKGQAPKDGTYPRSQRPAEPVATGFFRGGEFEKIRCRFCGSDARNGAVCAGFARNQAKDSGARIGANGFERKTVGRRAEISVGR